MNEVKVSEVNLVPVRFNKGLTFFASFTIDKKYFVGSVAVYSLKDGSGFRLVYPTKKLSNGEQIAVFYPVDKTSANQIQEIISSEAKKLLKSSVPMEGRQ